VPSNRIRQPTPNDLKAQCPRIVTNPVTSYNNFWEVYLCGFYDTKDLTSIRTALLSIWSTKYPDIQASCNCLNVDIFPDQISHTSSDGQTITRLKYLVYAGVYNLLIEKGKVLDSNKIPSQAEVARALEVSGFKSCRSVVVKPVAFSVTLCGVVRRDEYAAIGGELSQAWQTELTLSGGGGGAVQVVVLGQEEYLSDDK